MRTPKEIINRSANQLGDRQPCLRGLLAQGLELLLGQVVVDALHASIIHTFGRNATAAVLALLALGAAPILAQEMAVPDAPVPATITSYKIIAFSQEREPDWRFVITFKDSNGKIYRDEHYGATSLPNPAGGEPINNPEGADSFLKQMNTTNFSTTSMVKRLLQHLVQHGKIPPSTVAGTPEVDK
jgi:hypothetical protein